MTLSYMILAVAIARLSTTAPTFSEESRQVTSRATHNARHSDHNTPAVTMAHTLESTPSMAGGTTTAKQPAWSAAPSSTPSSSQDILLHDYDFWSSLEPLQQLPLDFEAPSIPPETIDNSRKHPLSDSDSPILNVATKKRGRKPKLLDPLSKTYLRDKKVQDYNKKYYQRTLDDLTSGKSIASEISSTTKEDYIEKNRLIREKNMKWIASLSDEKRRIFKKMTILDQQRYLARKESMKGVMKR